MALVQRSRGRVAFDGVPTVPGLVYISGTTLTATTSFLDIVLPSQYAWFHLSLINFAASDPANDNVSFCFSTDGGTTFISDAGHSIYTNINWQGKFVENVSGTEIQGFQDSLGYIAAWVGGHDGVTGRVFSDITFWPGNSTSSPVWSEVASVELPVSSGFYGNSSFAHSQIALDRSTNNTTPFARVNVVRLLPYDQGTPTPSAGHGLASGGSYALWGFRA